jgi:flagellar hook-associated protein 3 FlgL
MRTTNNMLINNMVRYLGNNLDRMQLYQSRLATGKMVRKPSDDPVIAARSLKLRTDVSEIEQYQRNIKDAQSWLELTESTLGNIGDVLHRARELAVQASNGIYGPDDLAKIKEEIGQLRTQIIHFANTTYAGRYIFSGYKTDTKLINDDESDPMFGTFNIDVLNSEDIKYEIGIGDDININVPGGDLFNAGADAATGTVGDMIQKMNDFLTVLNTGDSSAIDTIVGYIDDMLGDVLRVRADVGARINRLQLTSNRLEADSINFTGLMSKNEDADIAKTIMDLKNEENVYRASLAAGARIILPSLVDFLR